MPSVPVRPFEIPAIVPNLSFIYFASGVLYVLNRSIRTQRKTFGMIF